VPQVIDAWWDSGSMPFAQWGAPWQHNDEFERTYPAQYICEAIDQTRGWFYSLMAVGTVVFGRSAYETVLCLGHILADDGRKMSKHLGNILEPVPLMDRHGADALRWFMLCSGSPWSARRVGHAALEEIVRKVLLTYWNTASFLTLYAGAAGWEPGTPVAEVADRPLLDRWALSELHRTVVEVDAAMEGFDTARAGKRLSAFIDDLSNWYVRRSRRRFWDGDPAALATLYECLEVLTRLLAPFTPFVTEAVHRALVTSVWPDLPDSVHLRDWPRIGADGGLQDQELAAQVALVRRLVELGRSARTASKVRTRQPLGRALVGTGGGSVGWSALPEELRAQVADELNVQSVEALGSAGGELVDVSVKPNFRALGRRFGSGTKAVAAAVSAADPAALADAVRNGGTATVTVDGDPVSLTAEELVVTETPRTGWAVAADGGETVALDLTVTPELRRAGIAREVVRLVQDARKASGLEVTDRIALTWSASSPEVAEAVREHADAVAGEVLATSFAEGAVVDGRRDDELGLEFSLAKAA
jgi:isoleucyl-tRNA synthetase